MTIQPKNAKPIKNYKKLVILFFFLVFVGVTVLALNTINANWLQGLNCVDGKGEIYYFEKKDFFDNKNVNHKLFLEKMSVAVFVADDCSDVYSYKIKINQNLVSTTIYKTLLTSKEKFIEKHKDAEAKFHNYLDDYNIKCNDCLVKEMVDGVFSEILEYSTGEPI